MNNALLLLGLAVLPFAAGPATTPAVAGPKLDGTSWTLSTLRGQIPAGHVRITLEFNAGRVQGTDGCNQYSGPYTTAGQHLEVGPDVLSTQMACPAEIMQLAGSYMSALLAVKTYRLTGQELDLLGAAGETLARLTMQTQSVTRGSQLIGINSGCQSVVSVFHDTESMPKFSAPGAIGGIGGAIVTASLII